MKSAAKRRKRGNSAFFVLLLVAVKIVELGYCKLWLGRGTALTMIACAFGLFTLVFGWHCLNHVTSVLGRN